MAAKLAKLVTWVLRLFQYGIAFILIGVCSYMVAEFRKHGYNVPQETVIPLLFSCLALFCCGWSLIAICCLGHHLQILAALLDFSILSGYIASAALLHNNYHLEDKKNVLRNWLIYIRAYTPDGQQTGETSLRVNRTGALVKLLDAGVMLMIILFFFTTLLSFVVAIKSSEKHGETYYSRPRDVEETTTAGETTDYTDESSYISEQAPPPRMPPRQHQRR